MLLGAATDYLRYWWHPIVLGVFVLLWLVPGTILVRRVLQRTEGLSRARRTTGFALSINFVSHGAGLIAMAVITGFLLVVALRTGLRALVLLAVLLGPAAMIAMVFVVLPFYFPRATPSPTRKLLLACTVPLTLSGVLLAGASLLPAYFIRQEQIKLGFCAQNLHRLYAGVTAYANRYPARPLGKLETLAEQGFVSIENLRCPAHPEIAVGYLFTPAPSYGSGADPWRMILWDRPGNHGQTRQVIFANGRPERFDPAQFAECLRRPENAAARAVEQAGGG